MKNILKIAAIVGLVSVLWGCGGGGGDARAPGPQTNSLSVEVVDSSGHVVHGITYGGGQRIRASYTDASGVAINAKLISFSVSTNAGAATLGDTTATTANGQAFVNVSPAAATSSGAATVTATVGGLTATVDFSISGTTATLGSLVFGINPLAASGNTSVRVPVTANGNPASGVNVSFAASCGAVSPSTTTSGDTGYASTTYSAVKPDGTSCNGATTLTATGPGSAISTGNLTVNTPSASAINFVSATPSQMFITGSGASSQSVLKFKVLDASGGASQSTPVTVSLQQNPGGVGLNAVGSVTDITPISDSNGVITVSVYAGSYPGPVQVKASLPADPGVYAYSTNLTVLSGPPSQNHFSISVSTFNVEGLNWDGTTTSLTARVADRQGNAVPAGTVVNFTSSGGQIGGSCVIALADGIASCSTTFASQNPRPSNGRVAVLSYTEGLKEYVDVNGNNVFDAGVDTLMDMGDAYRDDDESGTFDASRGEFVVSRGATGSCAGSGGYVPSRANTCDGTTAATTVRRQSMLIMSGSTAHITDLSVTNGSISFLLNDANGLSGNGTALSPVYVNPMPFGTTVVPVAIDNTASNNLACTVLSTVPGVVPNVAPTLYKTDQLGTVHTIYLSGCVAGDQVRVTVTTPRGTDSLKTYTLP
ncbi:MAG: hypothetical protein ACKOWD_09860 [Rhodoferax sp.]